jgi:hypothetical protein
MRKRASDHSTLASPSRPGLGHDSPRRKETLTPIPNSVELELACWNHDARGSIGLCRSCFIRHTGLCGWIAALLAFECHGYHPNEARFA